MRRGRQHYQTNRPGSLLITSVKSSQQTFRGDQATDDCGGPKGGGEGARRVKAASTTVSCLRSTLFKYQLSHFIDNDT